MKCNTYGRKMIGLRKIAGETKSLRGFYSGEYLQLFYNTSNGRTWTIYKYNLGHNSDTVYDDSNIIPICNLTDPHTMQEIANLIHRELYNREVMIEKWNL